MHLSFTRQKIYFSSYILINFKQKHILLGDTGTVLDKYFRNEA